MEMTGPHIMRTTGDGLLIIDVQLDLCPGGALPVPAGHAVVPVLNEWLAASVAKRIPVYASRDWHPLNHPSFLERDGQWPPHCIQETPGARFHPDLHLPANALIITKGVRFDRDQYSVFDQTGLLQQLEYDQIKRLWVGGLAQDVGVLASVLEARRAVMDIVVIGAATRPLTMESGCRAFEEMAHAGAEILL
jgi:nicotinamidase/pyrazinamidase